MPSGHDLTNYYAREDERRGHHVIRDTDSINASYDRYLQGGVITLCSCFNLCVQYCLFVSIHQAHEGVTQYCNVPANITLCWGRVYNIDEWWTWWTPSCWWSSCHKNWGIRFSGGCKLDDGDGRGETWNFTPSWCYQHTLCGRLTCELYSQGGVSYPFICRKVCLCFPFIFTIKCVSLMGVERYISSFCWLQRSKACNQRIKTCKDIFAIFYAHGHHFLYLFH